MGGSSSKTVIEVAPVQSKAEIKRQVDQTLVEVNNQRSLITKNVIEEVEMNQNSVALRYSDLKDKREIVNHIRGIVKGEQAVQFLTEQAEKMIDVFGSSKAMKELQRWNQVKKIKKCGNKAVGMELHYKVIITEQKVGRLACVGGGQEETVVILGYKFIEHALSTDPNKLPDEEERKALRF